MMNAKVTWFKSELEDPTSVTNNRFVPIYKTKYEKKNCIDV